MNSIERQDEILELLYWFRGENVATRVAAAQVEQFVGVDRAAVDAALDALVARGLLVSDKSDGAYELTTAGIDEARRRFQDDFAPYLGKESHVECGDPDCECHRDGDAHAARACRT